MENKCRTATLLYRDFFHFNTTYKIKDNENYCHSKRYSWKPTLRLCGFSAHLHLTDPWNLWWTRFLRHTLIALSTVLEVWKCGTRPSEKRLGAEVQVQTRLLVFQGKEERYLTTRYPVIIVN